MEYGLRDTELPKTVVIPKERQQAQDDAIKATKELQNAYKRLQGFADLAPLPPIQEITKEWLNSIIANKFDEVAEMKGITENERIQRVEGWKNIKSGANMVVTGIVRIVDKYGGAIRYDDSLHLPYIDTTGDILDAFCTRDVPEEATEHHRRLLAVARAISELRFWEFNNHVKRLPLPIILQWDNSTIAEKWATGDVLDIDPDSVKPYLRERVIVRQAYERRTIL
ncbi:MAG: hypothetical protein IKH26_12695 [Bacteroidaceae bacterium]|nr:hypothetical protein [Bacteroidaceae bacterium]